MINKFLRVLVDTLSISPLSGDVVDILSPRPRVIPRDWLGEIAPSETKGFKAELKSAASKGWLVKPNYLPNTSNFSIKLSDFNGLLLSQGIVSRYASKKVFYLGRNKRLNRYLSYCYVRLYRLRENPQMYWKLALWFIIRSNVYLILCLHGIDKNLYQKLGKRDMARLLRKLDNLRGHSATFLVSKMMVGCYYSQRTPTRILDHYIHYHRTYIPKGDTFRPLGVPTLAYRIFLRSLLMPLLGCQELGAYQHGFIPRRGTLTAWRQVSRIVIPSKFIYELDFKGFFPSVNPQILKKLELFPEDIQEYLTLMNYSLPSLPLKVTNPNEDITDIFKRIGKLRESLGMGTAKADLTQLHLPELGWSEESFDSLRVKIQHDARKFKWPYWKVGELMREIADLSSAAMRVSTRTNFRSLENNLYVDHLSQRMNRMVTPNRNFGFVGLPQGSPISPILSIILLDKALEQILRKYPSVKPLFYADDGLFYSDNKKEMLDFIKNMPQRFLDYGIKVHPDKSRWVKQDGLWITPLKFLGFIYFAELNKWAKGIDVRSLTEGFEFHWGFLPLFSSDTRKGARLSLTHFFSLSNVLYRFNLITSTSPKGLESLLEACRSRSHKNSAIKKAMITYYENLIKLQKYVSVPVNGIPVVQYWWLEFILSLSKWTHVYTDMVTQYFLSGAYRLKDAGYVNTYVNWYESLTEDEVLAMSAKDAEIFGPAGSPLGPMGAGVSHYSDNESPQFVERDMMGLEINPAVADVTELSYDNQGYLTPSSRLAVSKPISLSFLTPWTSSLSKEEIGMSSPYHFFLLISYYWFDWLRLPKDLFNWVPFRLEVPHVMNNLLNSVYSGLLFSRGYIGSLNPKSEQSFKYDPSDDSIGDFFRLRYGNGINVFNGSTYATYELVHHLSHIQRRKAFHYCKLELLSPGLFKVS